MEVFREVTRLSQVGRAVGEKGVQQQSIDTLMIRYLAHDCVDFQEQGRLDLLPQGSAIAEVMEVWAVTLEGLQRRHSSP